MMYLESGIESSSLHADAPAYVRSGPQPQSLDGHIATGSTKMLKAREHVFTAGDPRSHVYRVESGAVCLYKILSDGRRQVVDFAFPGDFIGLGCNSEHALDAQALEPSRLKCLPVGTLARLADRDPRLGVRLYEALSRELTATRDHLFTVGQRSAAERLACFLLSLSRRNARHGQDASTIVLPMTRSDIADFLGLTIETVSRTLTKFRSAKMIDLEQCTLVRLIDIVALERLARGEATV